MRDYFIQFFRKLNSDRRFEQRFYEQVIADVHPYEDNPAYRSLYLSIESLDDLLAGFAVDTLSLSVSAQPPFDPPRQPVGCIPRWAPATAKAWQFRWRRCRASSQPTAPCCCASA